MLGYVIVEGRGTADRLLADVARRLGDDGWPLAGAIQINAEREGAVCDMDLHVLAGDRVVRISQRLGALARGCRLDPAGLEQAVGLVARAIEAAGTDRPRLMIVNKFGKQEADGRGFRPLIGQALADGIPVLTAVGAANRPAFDDFAEQMAEPVEPEIGAVLTWCRKVCA